MTLNKPKVNTNQNLMPNRLAYKYLYQRSIMPVLIAVIAIIAISFLIYYGVPQITLWLQNEAFELNSQSLESVNASNKVKLSDKMLLRDSKEEEYNNYYIDNPIQVEIDESILVTLKDEIARLEIELRQLEASNNIPVIEKYNIEKLLLFIDRVRTDDITIVSFEDSNSAEATGNSPLIYQNDIGEATFSLHGFATDVFALSDFLVALNNCTYVASTEIVSVETQTKDSETNMYVFEVSITPLVTVKEANN